MRLLQISAAETHPAAAINSICAQPTGLVAQVGEYSRFSRQGAADAEQRGFALQLDGPGGMLLRGNS
jgi:hypothetical protein